MPADGTTLTAALFTTIPAPAWEQLHTAYRAPRGIQDVWAGPVGRRGFRSREIRAARAEARRRVKPTANLPLLLSLGG